MNDQERLNSISEAIIGATIDVHKAIGPGLLESAYEACLAYELRRRGLKIEQQKELPLKYRDVQLDCGYRLDLLVEDSVIVEVKAIEALLPLHQTQLMSYLRLTNCRLGLIINFNVTQLTRGIKRVVNEFPDSAVSANSAVSGVS
jgi:GxxExxY protein